ncbi:hypothetical protein VTK56DRAFT_9597 [Thermocarpiscus australiensis]
MASSAANIVARPNPHGSTPPVTRAEMQQLVDDLPSFLEIAEESISASSSRSTDLLGYFNDHAAEPRRFRTAIRDLGSFVDKAQWRGFLHFMELRARAKPYPKYLYRAQIYTKGCGMFASDYHRQQEYEARKEIPIPMDDPTQMDTIDDIAWALKQHLNKTQINLWRERNG